jgi:uncharacterized membrane protein YphA (DoxX/SURF4 family)
MATTYPLTNGASQAPGKAWNVVLWLAQLLLAVPFGMAGLMKSVQPIEEIGKMIVWAPEMPGLVRFIGVSELAGALGLLLPALTRIRPGLTPLAAAGLALIMVLAVGFHVMRGEFADTPINFVLGGIALFIVWGRTKKAPIAARG